MALVPVIIPLVVKIWCTKKELSINMKEQEKKYPSSVEIKNLRVLKIVFPIVVTTVVALFVPSAVPLIGMLMFGNLIKEIGSDTSRLFDAASNSIMNAATIFLGLSVGATMTTEAFLNWTTIGIVIGGFLAFALSISGGILFVKLVNLFTKKKINPLIGATGLSAVPMASRVANEIALKYDPKIMCFNIVWQVTFQELSVLPCCRCADFIPTIKIIVFKLFGHELYGNYRCFRQYCKICIVRVFYSLSVSFSWLKQ